MRYAFQSFDSKTMARAKVIALPISTKQAIEVCKFVKKFKDLDKAITIVEEVIAKKRAVPFTRFTEGAGHKPGIGSGKYPVKVSKYLLKLLLEVKANALAKGLESLQIIHLAANKASRPYKYGRFTRRQAKRTHLEVVVKGLEFKQEVKRELKKKQAQKQVQVKQEVQGVQGEKQEEVKERVVKEQAQKQELEKQEKSKQQEKQQAQGKQERPVKENKVQANASKEQRREEKIASQGDKS